ncbi:MAG: alpha/beta hydrolase fold domain-containing protein [Alphaproteobacteria bacterium]|nr:alpha/beta hydrolase fold domain-containing protein [Alphaproteobacteria bacterium]
MGQPVYQGYDADELYAQYNNRGMVPDFADYGADNAHRSDVIRASGQAMVLDIAYGALPAQQTDLFLPDATNPPLHIFIHGGYWQWNDRKPYAFVAEQMVPAGAAVATIGYPLCPTIGFRELCDSVRTGIAYLWRHAADHGYDRDRIHVSGHSAGGHLTALMAATDWPAFENGLPVDLIKSTIPISGVFDLEPIRHTPIGDPLSLDAETAHALSPLFLPAPAKGPMTITVGGDESAEFHRQAATYRQHLRGQGVSADVLDITGKHHFSVVAELAVADSPLLRRALELMGL